MWRGLLTRLPDIRVTGEPVYGTGNFFHAVQKLAVTFGPEA